MFELLLFLGSFLFFFHFFMRSSIKKTGQKLQSQLDAVFSAGHEFASVRADEFDVDHDYYNARQAELESHGFRWVDDLEDVTLTQNCPETRTFQRLMVTPDGKFRATVSHLRPRGFLVKVLVGLKLIPGNIYAVEISTEMNAGLTLSTNNLKGTHSLDLPPQLDIMALESDTPVEELVYVQRQRVEKFLAENPEQGFHPATERDQLIAAAQRVLMLCEKFRKEKGYSAEELARVSGPMASKKTVEQLSEEINKPR